MKLNNMLKLFPAITIVLLNTSCSPFGIGVDNRPCPPDSEIAKSNNFNVKHNKIPCTAYYGAKEPEAVTDNNGNIVVTWTELGDFRQNNFASYETRDSGKIYLQRWSSDGKSIDKEKIKISDNGYIPSVAVDSKNNIFISWLEVSGTSSSQTTKLMLQSLDNNGIPKDKKEIFSYVYSDHAIAFNKNDDLIIAASKDKNVQANIYDKEFNLKKSFSADNIQPSFKITSDEQNNFIFYSNHLTNEKEIYRENTKIMQLKKYNTDGQLVNFIPSTELTFRFAESNFDYEATRYSSGEILVSGLVYAPNSGKNGIY